MNCAEIAHYLKVIGDGKEAVGLVKLYRTGQLSFSTLVLPKQFCRFIFENVAQRHSLNAALRQRFLRRGIFANQRIRRIALHAHQAILYLSGDTSNPSENDIPARASQNPSKTNARRMATIPRSIGKVTAHGSFDSTASVTPAKIH